LHEPLPDVVPNTRKIAVLRPSALGDFIFSLPALDALHETYPDAEIVLLGLRWHEEFLRRRPGPVHRVIVVPTSRGVGAPADANQDEAELDAWFRWMAQERFDIALQLHGGGRHSNPFVERLGARVTAGFRAADAPALDRFMPYVYHQNERVRQLEAVALVGASMWSLTSHLVVTASDRAEADAALPERCKGVAHRPLVVLQPGATDPRRRWPAKRFAALADALVQRGAQVAINGSSNEHDLVAEVLRNMQEDALDLSGQLTLRGLAGLLSRAQLVVSNDTGPLHLAEAVGAATVGIYWLTNLGISGSLSCSRHRYALSFRTTCPTCGRVNLEERCEHDDSFVADVPLGDVLSPAIELLRDAPPADLALHRPLYACRYA
jgi:ADP-heptose:LPS heptosyltransferase